MIYFSYLLSCSRLQSRQSNSLAVYIVPTIVLVWFVSLFLYVRLSCIFMFVCIRLRLFLFVYIWLCLFLFVYVWLRFFCLFSFVYIWLCSTSLVGFYHVTIKVSITSTQQHSYLHNCSYWSYIYLNKKLNFIENSH